jgi:hypothetical protein
MIMGLKARILGLSVIQRSRARQRSRITWLRHGDANTKFFHIMANQRRKKHIHSLQTDEGLAVTQADKQRAVLDHFNKQLGSYVPRSCTLNLENLGWASRSLQHLEAPISEVELRSIIQSMPKEKALGLDDFIRKFFSLCWGIIKNDLLLAVQHFLNMNQQGLNLLNQAFIVLIPKKECPLTDSDYMPISLIHSFAKIVYKILANSWLQSSSTLFP